MPPRDGDGIFTEGEDELVAQIIPLRRQGLEPDERHSGPDELYSQAREPEPQVAERSVWDEPATELRRREPPATRRRRRAAAAATVAVICVLVLALALGIFQGRSGSGARPAGSSASRARLAAKSNNATVRRQAGAGSSAVSGATRPSSSPQRSSASHGVLHRHQPRGSGQQRRQTVQSAAAVTPTAPALVPAESSMGTPAQQRAVYGAPAASQGSSASHSECVPGELGC